MNNSHNWIILLAIGAVGFATDKHWIASGACLLLLFLLCFDLAIAKRNDEN